MNRTIFLIGTDHKYQHNSNLYEEVDSAAIIEFKEFIKQSCTENRINAIGEEFSLEDLKQDKNHSFVREIALELGIHHKYCNATRKEEEALGVKKYLNQRKGESSSDFDQRDWENEKLREYAWLEKVIKLNIWPLLFVCGSLHVISFGRLLLKNNLDIKVLSSNWDYQ